MDAARRAMALVLLDLMSGGESDEVLQTRVDRWWCDVPGWLHGRAPWHERLDALAFGRKCGASSQTSS